MADAVRMRVQVQLQGLERVRVLLAVQDELEHQALRWGGPAHDDAHTLAEWVRFMRDSLRKAELTLRAGRHVLGRGPVRSSGPMASRAVVAMRAGAVELVLDELRQVAALAVAALESQDRQGLRVRSRAHQEAVRSARADLPTFAGPPAAARIDPEVFLRSEKPGTVVPRRPAKRRRSRGA